jgi:hypothetical protein
MAIGPAAPAETTESGAETMASEGRVSCGIAIINRRAMITTTITTSNVVNARRAARLTYGLLASTAWTAVTLLHS